MTWLKLKDRDSRDIWVNFDHVTDFSGWSDETTLSLASNESRSPRTIIVKMSPEDLHHELIRASAYR